LFIKINFKQKSTNTQDLLNKIKRKKILCKVVHIKNIIKNKK